MLALNVPHVSVSSLQKTTKPMMENDVVCVMKNYVPVFYTIKPEKLDEIISGNNDSIEYKYPAFKSQLTINCLERLKNACENNNLQFNSILIRALSLALKEIDDSSLGAIDAK